MTEKKNLRQTRRRFSFTMAAALLFAATSSLTSPALAKEPKEPKEPKEEKKDKKDKEPPRERYQTGQYLAINGVTAPLAGPQNKQVAMNLMIDMGSQPVAVEAEEMMPKVLSVVIIELNKEPLGQNGRLGPDDLDNLKLRLLSSANRVLGGRAKDVFIRNLQEVKKFKAR